MNEFKVGDKVKFIPEVLEAEWFQTSMGLNFNDEYTVQAISKIDLLLQDHSEYFAKCWFELAGKKDTTNKLDWTLLPFNELKSVIEVLHFGAKKYSRDNWQKVNPEEYKKACMRHLIAFYEGEWLDPESNLPHLAHLICNAIFLLWFKNNENKSN